MVSVPVTVVIPSYNYAAWLEEAVRSVFAQTVSCTQIIVSDDGSSDDSVAVARRLARESSIPFEVIASEHVGLHESLNRSLRAATGELVAFLAADDRWRPDFLERQVAHFDDRRVVIAHCESTPIDASGNPLPPTPPSGVAAEGDCLTDLVRGRCTMRTGPVVRRAEVMAFGGFDPTYPQEDWSFYLRCASRGRVAYSREPLVERRIHGTNSSVNFARSRNWEFVFRAAAVPLLEELAPSKEVLNEALAFHLSAPIRMSLFHGHFAAAGQVLAGAIRHYPALAPALARESLRGLAAWGWHRSGRRVLSGRRLQRVEALLRRAAGIR